MPPVDHIGRALVLDNKLRGEILASLQSSWAVATLAQ